METKKHTYSASFSHAFHHQITGNLPDVAVYSAKTFLPTDTSAYMIVIMLCLSPNLVLLFCRVLLLLLLLLLMCVLLLLFLFERTRKISVTRSSLYKIYVRTKTTAVGEGKQPSSKYLALEIVAMNNFVE
jgi:hypothetical protein